MTTIEINVQEAGFAKCVNSLVRECSNMNDRRDMLGTQFQTFLSAWEGTSKQSLSDAFDALRAEGIEYYREGCRLQLDAKAALEEFQKQDAELSSAFNN